MLKKAFFDNAWVLLLAIVGFLLILCFTHHGGIGISPDSIAYVSVARNVCSGHGLTGYDEEPFVLFPLFYPSFLSAIMFFFRKDIVVLAPILNGIIFAISIFFSAKMLKINRWLQIPTILTMVCSVALLEVYTMLWSETVFILLIVFFILTTNKYLSTNQLKYLILGAVLASVACVTRYAAVTVFASGLLLLFANREKLFKKRIVDCLIFGLIGISFLVINLLRNYISTGILTGKRQPSITPLFKNIELLGSVFAEWFSPFEINSATSSCIGFLILIGFSVLFIYLIFRNKQIGYLYTACGFFIVYAWFMVISASISRYEPINSRLLSPLFIPFLIVLANFTQQIALRKTSKFLVPIGIVLMLTFAYVQIKNDQANFKNANEGGIGGYTEDSWKESPTLRFLQNNKQILTQEDFTVYSNASQAVYFYTNEGADRLPERKYKDDVRVFYEEDEFYLVWFNFEDNVDLLNLKEVAQKNTMQELKRFEDGVIYRCTAKR